MRRLVWIVPLMSFLVFACTDRDTRITNPGTDDTPDMITQENGVTAELYNSDNAVTHKQLKFVADYGGVRDAVTSFEGAGYVVDNGSSFVIRGRGADGSPVDITVFAMGHTTYPHRDAVYLVHIDSVEGRVVVPLRVSFEKIESDAEIFQIGESVWLSWAGTLPAAATPWAAAGGLAAKMSILEWLKCVGERIAAGTVACALVCRFAPVVYMQCLANCATGHVAFALVSCTIQAL